MDCIHYFFKYQSNGIDEKEDYSNSWRFGVINRCVDGAHQYKEAG